MEPCLPLDWVQYLTRKFNATDVLLRNLAHNGASIDNDLIAVTDHETGVAQQVRFFFRDEGGGREGSGSDGFGFAGRQV